MSEIRTQYLFEVTIDVAPPMLVGETPAGDQSK